MAQSRDRPRPVSARASSWAGPLLTAFAIAVFSVVVAGPPPDLAQVLDCEVSEALPSPAAAAAAGGFNFSYQSLGGEAVDGRSCTVYRLKNAVGSPPTPVRWLAGEEILIDIARLKRCGAEADCAWFEVARYFDGDFVGGLTQLSFGLNADSFRLRDDGLVARTAPDVEGAKASVGTEVAGVLTLADDSEVVLDMVVKSRFERREGAVALIYEVVTTDLELLEGGRIALIWARPDSPLGPRLPLSAEARPFLVMPASVTRLAGAADARVDREGGTVAVEILVEEFEYLPFLRLSVVEPSRPDDILLSVPLPAFVPAER